MNEHQIAIAFKAVSIERVYFLSPRSSYTLHRCIFDFKVGIFASLVFQTYRQNARRKRLFKTTNITKLTKNRKINFILYKLHK